MVHAENHDMIQWLAHHLVEQGHGAPKFHAIAHARVAEAEATNRAISLARLVDAPLLLVHMSEIEAIETLRQAQKKGLKIFGETCPQYIALTADDMDKPGVEGAMWCCSPPPRDSAAQEAVWAALKDGTFQTFSSDHAPYQFNDGGKIPKGDKTTFKEMANGVPGIEIRLPMLFSEGVQKGRITLQQFVALTSANHAKLYGLYPRKGTIAVGSDADFAIWDADKDVTVTWKDLHDNVGYTPYEGRQIKGWPITVVSRGRVVVEDGKLNAERGSGQFLPCASPDSSKPHRPERARTAGHVALRPEAAVLEGRMTATCPRRLKVSSAQLGPINLADSRASVVKRMIEMLKEADSRGSKFVVFPELALTTFFPRYWMEDPNEVEKYFESADAEPRDAAAVRAGAREGHRLLPGLCRAHRGRRLDASLQHVDPRRDRTDG